MLSAPALTEHRLCPHCPGEHQDHVDAVLLKDAFFKHLLAAEKQGRKRKEKDRVPVLRDAAAAARVAWRTQLAGPRITAT